MAKEPAKSDSQKKRHIEGAINQVVDAFVEGLQINGDLLAKKPTLTLATNPIDKEKEAVTKIQSVFHGYKARKKLKEKTAAKETSKQYDTTFEDLLELAKQKSLEDLQASGRSVMISGNEGENTIVLSTIREFAKSQSIDTEKEEDFAKLFNTEKESFVNKHAEAINKEVNKVIEEKIEDKTLTNLSPSSQANGETSTYEHKEASLTQTGNDKDGYEFNTQGNFSGILRVQRRMDNGELSEDNVDVVEYKNGKPIAVSLAKEGKGRIANIGPIKREVERNAGIYVSTKKQTDTQEMSLSFKPSSVPNVKPKSTRKGRQY